MRRYDMEIRLLVILFFGLGLSGCASVNEEADHFRYAALSAARDFGVTTKPIPTQLQRLQNPFGAVPIENCQAWYHEAYYLERAIVANEGRRVGYRRDNSNFTGRFGNLRDVGVKTAATFFTPYRGVVRQATGAAAYEKEAQDADQRARLRLGYLVGQARAYKCPGF